ncbi:HD-GYP domain-containing protein [Alkalicella caledoniensis]|uniref:HD-GYP domain-containing protein n=1 Tax=Alkalicella caledoniensis TaxID=2731377 RepID=A0A7G9W9C5_ALKCA|nr:HD-GYP domain-containing protein [Alkalicella caledoniensis]QNO15287.1 HD-GYP domain-containing protein [Alkalicella caledoniensis]
MRIVNSNKLKPGDTVGRDVLTKHGSIFIAKETVLTEHMIYKLISLGVDNVHVKDLEELIDYESIPRPKPPEDIVEFTDKYQQALFLTGELLDAIASGKKLETEMIREIVDIVYGQVMSTNNILGRLTYQKHDNQYLNKHSLNVAILSGIIGKWLNRSNGEVRRLIFAGLTHDLGKLKVPKRILDKPSRLTDEEFKEMQKHSAFGYQLLNTKADISKDVALAVLQHHEREDGSGYPTGLKGEAIHLFGKILAVADVYDAMSSNKNYRDKFSPFQVAEQIAQNSFGSMDPRVSRVFLDNISRFYVGNSILLSDGKIGDIIYINPSEPTRPVIKLETGDFLDLSKSKLKIIDILG